jgi:hypothetical protein
LRLLMLDRARCTPSRKVSKNGSCLRKETRSREKGKSMEILNKRRGTGCILSNGELLLKDVRYQVTVWRDPGGADLQLDGRLDVNYRDALTLLEDQRPLTLQLEDGRSFGFRMLTTTGRISGSGTELPVKRELRQTGIPCLACHAPIATVGHIGAEGLTMNCPGCGHRWAARDSA